MGGRRFFFLVSGSLGDMLPVVAVAKAVAADGHGAVIGGHPDFQPMVEGEGLEFLPLGRPDRPDSGSSLNKAIELYIMEPLPKVIDELDAAVGDDDVIVAHPLQLAGHLVAERRKLPWLTASLFSQMIPTASRHPIPVRGSLTSFGAPINRMLWGRFGASLDKNFKAGVEEQRRRLGLSGPSRPILDLMASPRQTLVFTSPKFVAAAKRELPPHVRATGFVVFDQIKMWQGAPGLDEFIDAGDPPVVFQYSSESTNLDAKTVFAAAQEACRRIGARGIFVGPVDDGEPGVRGSFYVTHFLPMTVVAERSRAAVHYGGSQTVATFAEAGKPTVVVPQALAAFENASVVTSLGIGARLKTITADGLTGALKQAFSLAPRAAQLGAEIRAEHGLRTATQVIEAAAAESASTR